ncbi:MAG: adenylate/guanylate cyclase domain-containing protein [archaeon]
MGKSIIFIFTAVLIALLVYSAAAEVMLSQPDSLYSLGDNIELNVAVKALSTTDDILRLTLVCENKSKEFYVLPLTLSAGSEETIDIGLSLSKSFLGDIKGSCNIEARYKDDFDATSSFLISDKIDVVANLDSIEITAGTQTVVKGTAIKANGQPLEGFVEIVVENSDIKITRSVTGGNFQANFSLPKTLSSGNYIINIRAYEKIDGEIANQGSASTGINLRQTASGLEIAMNTQTLKPGENVSFKITIYDQASNKLTGDISIKILDIWDDVVFEKLAKNEDMIVYSTDKNTSAGYWKIIASSKDLKKERLFYIEEYEDAEFKIINDTLIVTNMGNVPYRKAVQIAIGNDVEIRELDLDIGESRRFRLVAPDGNYQVSVTDGSSSIDLSQVTLTGNIIGVMDIRKQAGLINRYPIVWLFLVVVVGLFMLMMIERVTKKRFHAYLPNRGSGSLKKAEKVEGKKQMQASKSEKEDYSSLVIPHAHKEAEHSLVHGGNKEKASILNLKIKNLNELSKSKGNAFQNIIKSLEHITSKKGSVYKSGDNIFGIFTPSLTRTFKNEIIASKVAREMASELNEHNSKFKEKIDFGIGVHAGDIIAKKDKNKLQFTSLGNTIGLSKKISQLAESDVLLSEEVRNRVMSEIKTEMKHQGDTKTFAIKDIRDRDEHNKFIREFLNRSKK